MSRHHLHDERRNSTVVGVGRKTCSDPQLAVGRQRSAHARRVYRIRYVDVSRDLAVNGVPDAGQRLVALDAHQHLVGRKLDTDIIRVVIVAAEVQHYLQHLVAVICTRVHINVNCTSETKTLAKDIRPTLHYTVVSKVIVKLALRAKPAGLGYKLESTHRV